MTVQERLATAVADALGRLGIQATPDDVHIERPQRPEHGDWSTNAALALAKAQGRNPRELATELAAALDRDRPEHVEGVEVAGPGFVNFRLAPTWLHEVLRQVVEENTERYAAPDLWHGEKVQVEFVSANPTGPVHVGNGWFGSYGDALARILSRTGAAVTREYYVNDTGNQMRKLGQSVLARRKGEEVPEDGYRGDYVIDLARRYEGPEDELEAGRFAADLILAEIKETLASMGIEFDEWFSQAFIEESGRVADTIGMLRERGHVYDKDGAVWLRATTFGDSRDRVLVKSNGDATYLAGDLAYHRNKFLERGFDRVIDVLGADHHGQVASLKAGVEALGVDPDRLEVRIGQLISLVGGRMSKRSGHYVTLQTLIDDLGPDATRLLSLVSSIDHETTLNLDVVRQQSAENPVYYVQYAHARIASIERVASERGIARNPLGSTSLEPLTHPRELQVLKDLADLSRVVAEAAAERAPFKVTNWLRTLAADFHGFYHDCRVIGEEGEEALTEARLWLVEATRIGLAIGLGLLGVHAPEAM